MTEIPIADPTISELGKEKVSEVLNSGQLAAGAQTAAFEAEFADFVGADHAVATANGTAALHAALVAAGIGPGDTVVTSPFSFVATGNAIRFVGAEPAFADVDSETLTLDPDSVEAMLDETDVDAVMPVHLYGLPAEMERFRELASRHGFALIEDAAQAHGARIRDRHVGTDGDAACFSFYPTKNMTTGEGGMVVTDDPAVADAAARFVDHGRPPAGDAYEHSTLGHNFKMTDVAAALGRVQLESLPEFVDARRRHASRLTERLAGTEAVVPTEPSGRRHAYNQYTIRVGNRDEVQRALTRRGVGSAVYYPTLIPDLKAYEDVDSRTPVATSTAERAVEEVLSLPVHPALDDGDVDRIADALAEIPTEEPNNR